MTKKHFIQLAECIKAHNHRQGWNPANYDRYAFSDAQLESLAAFCQAVNPRFNRSRWLGYIAGTNGPNGGAIKPITKVA